MNKDRFLRNVEQLGNIGWKEGQGLFRMAFTPLFLEGRTHVEKLMKEAGMNTRVDAVGNLFGRYEGTDPHAPAVLLGSHLDSVPGGGKYDGHLGVLSALEAAQSLHERLPHAYPLEVVGFNAEEGGEMGGTFGSRAVCSEIDSLPDPSVLQSFGLTEEGIKSAQLDFAKYSCYLELHIEQGPVLWRRKIPIGIPTAIVGITRYRVTLQGQANHAGTTPMLERQDAMKETVALLSNWYNWVEEHSEENFVCNVGHFSLQPNAAPVVPGKASFILELRSTDDRIVEMLSKKFKEFLSTVSLPATMELMVSKPAVALDASLQAKIKNTCSLMGVQSLSMPSGAGHDASPLAHRLPAAMIFVPSINGISHSLEEETDAEDMVLGTSVLEKLLESL